jgi:hypothetical protein
MSYAVEKSSLNKPRIKMETQNTPYRPTVHKKKNNSN